MRGLLVFFLISLGALLRQASAQSPGYLLNDLPSWKVTYRAAGTKFSDLVHTKLEVRFDYQKCYLYGKAWITLRPHFYSTDSVVLDAKGMDIHAVALVVGQANHPVKYTYDGLRLFIRLPRIYKRGESYMLFVDYTSKPNELSSKVKVETSGETGLNFINPQGTLKNKPTQIYTDGETEKNSVWMPTIDQPNQKSTLEIAMTVPDKYVTLSNGLLVKQNKLKDSSRTDYWKLDQPIAPYLFFMGVGDYAIVRDNYRGKEVAYYVEPAYQSVAREIFGHTPEMMAFFSSITGVDYPWPKYSQITGRDYTAGAMENTTCTLHNQRAQQDARQLVDGNFWESVIAHELFHHWFGDLVTTESWSNLTLNESFADFSEKLWMTYKYGRDRGDETHYQAIQAYLSDSASATKDLVRYHYRDREDMFDNVTYTKGGKILSMLRNYVGDSAFFRALNLYLTTYQFKSAEASELREAFEQTTGQDLHWFWDQWYYGSGHPKLVIDYQYDDSAKKVTVLIHQTQTSGKIFRVPLAIDLYWADRKMRRKVWLEQALDTFQFTYDTRPDLVNVDGDKMLLCEKKDNKTLSNFIFQYKAAGLYADRREAIDFCLAMQTSPMARALIKASLKDPYYGIRLVTLRGLNFKNDSVRADMEPAVAALATTDPNPLVRARSIELLGTLKKMEYATIFTNALTDSSYTVAGYALEALAAVDSVSAIRSAKKMAYEEAKGRLRLSIIRILVRSGDPSSVDAVASQIDKMDLTPETFQLLREYGKLLAVTSDPLKFKHGVDQIVAFRAELPEGDAHYGAHFVNTNILKSIADTKEAAGVKDQADYVKSKMAAL